MFSPAREHRSGGFYLFIKYQGGKEEIYMQE